jgi:hypothetical protein
MRVRGCVDACAWSSSLSSSVFLSFTSISLSTYMGCANNVPPASRSAAWTQTKLDNRMAEAASEKPSEGNGQQHVLAETLGSAATADLNSPQMQHLHAVQAMLAKPPNMCLQYPNMNPNMMLGAYGWPQVRGTRFFWTVTRWRHRGKSAMPRPLQFCRDHRPYCPLLRICAEDCVDAQSCQSAQPTQVVCFPWLSWWSSWVSSSAAPMVVDEKCSDTVTVCFYLRSCFVFTAILRRWRRVLPLRPGVASAISTSCRSPRRR